MSRYICKTEAPGSSSFAVFPSGPEVSTRSENFQSDACNEDGELQDENKASAASKCEKSLGLASIAPAVGGASSLMRIHLQEMETLLAELKDGTGDSESLAVSGDHSFMIAPIVNTLGYFYYNIGNKEEAKNLFEEYLNLYPDGYNSYDSMGEFYYNEGDMENALKFYKKAKEMYPAATSANMMIEEISKS